MSLLLQSGRRASPLLQRLARAFSAQASPSGGGSAAGSDIVLDSFREQQKQIREVMEGMKSIPVPLSGDPAAVKKFAADVEALKRKAGVPDEAELESALVAFRLKSSGGDLRKALASLTADDDSGLEAALTSLVDAVEKESGAALTDANTKGWALLASKVSALAKQRGLDDVAKVKADATVQMYASAIRSLREGAADAVSAAARRDGLEGVVSVDAAALKPKW